MTDFVAYLIFRNYNYYKKLTFNKKDFLNSCSGNLKKIVFACKD